MDDVFHTEIITAA